jgi:hypothetical protein
MVISTASGNFLKYEEWVAWCHSKKLASLMKFFTGKYLQSLVKPERSAISFSDPMEEPRI